MIRRLLALVVARLARLWPLVAVQTILDLNEDRVLELIDTGELSPAFDIRVPAARRRAIRVHENAVAAYQDGKPQLSLQAALDSMVPQLRPSLLGREVRRCLFASGSHLTALIRAGALMAVAAPSRRGPDSSPTIPVANLVAFLIQRRVA